MPKTIRFEGRSYQFPDDASDDEIASALGADSGVTPTSASSGPILTPALAGGMGAAAAAPALARGLNVAAGRLGAIGPAATALTVANDLRQGNVGDAVVHGATGAGLSGLASKALPKVAEAVRTVTAPPGTRASSILDASGKAMTTATRGGVVSRMASALQRYAGPAAIPLGVLGAMNDSRTAMLNAINDPTTEPETRQAYLDFLNSGAGN